MVTTRSTRQTKTPPIPRLVNPTLPENWPPEPSTATEFDQWLTLTKAALLKWLTEAAAAAQDAPTAAAIAAYTTATDARWTPYKLQTDTETGQIYDAAQRAAMETAIENEKRACADLHKQHETWRKFAEHRYAQAAYEDFLYYQNVWNRRNYVPYKVYSETAPGRKGAKIRQAFTQAMRPEGGDGGESDGDVVATGKGKAPIKKKNKKTYEYGLTREPTRGTTKQEKMNRRDVDWNDEPFFGIYTTWLNHMIALYTSARLGYRKRIPDVVAPEDTHRCTQPPRGTTPRIPLRNEKRHRHLEERFPRRKRVQIDVDEVEELYRSKSERREDVRLERMGRMKDIGWRVDEDAYARMKAEKEAKSGFATDPLTLKLLPKEHKTHHGSRETSFNWPTSFDSPEWGDGVAVTGVKREYVYEEVGDDDDDEVGDSDKADAGDSNRKRTIPRYRLDENEERIKKIDERPRYKKEGYTQQGKQFEHEKLGSGVAGRDRDGEWVGSFVDGNISKERWELDEDGNRIPLPPPYMSQNRFTTVIVQTSYLRETRPERHANRRITDQLSDDEDKGCVDSNENFPWSGNMNPDQLGGAGASNDDSSDAEGADYPGDDDGSDDDGDLFASSYKACSSTCPKKERARLLLKELQDTYGKVQGMGLQQIMDMQQHEEGFIDLTDDEIREEYQEAAKASQRARGES